MSVQLFRLRGVPDDEAEDVRELLGSHDIEYYETPPGNWGISMPALWLHDSARLEEARALIDTYQKERAARAREERAQLKRSGAHRTLVDEIREQPLRFAGYLLVALVVLYFSTKPFLTLGQ